MSRTAKKTATKRERPFTVTIQIHDANDLARFEAHRARIRVDADSAVALSLVREGLDAVEARA